jgi:mono/diheme cytochrome c family protein
MRCLASLRLRAVRLALFLLATVAIPAAASSDERTAETRRLLELLTGIRINYSEAFEDGGEELESPVELEEARLLLAEVRTLNARLDLVPAATLSDLAGALDSHVGRPDVSSRLIALVDDIGRRTGTSPDTVPPSPPSAARGRVLYQENCAGCHGERGAGDGPDGVRADIRPADFTNVVFMRRETPLDLFMAISLGRGRRGMPAWAQGFTVQQRWDAIAYVWSLGQSDADRREAATLWAERCRSCHGAVGEGVAGAAASWPRTGALVERNDRALFVAQYRGPHAAATAGLDDARRWRLVAHTRALTLGGPLPPAVTRPASRPSAPARRRGAG